MGVMGAITTSRARCQVILHVAQDVWHAARHPTNSAATIPSISRLSTIPSPMQSAFRMLPFGYNPLNLVFRRWVSRDFLAQVVLGKEKRIWVIKEKRTKEKGNSGKRPSALRTRNAN